MRRRRAGLNGKLVPVVPTSADVVDCVRLGRSLDDRTANFRLNTEHMRFIVVLQDSGEAASTETFIPPRKQGELQEIINILKDYQVKLGVVGWDDSDRSMLQQLLDTHLRLYFEKYL